jgi:ribosomal protein S18 acetylase RimI-like enzyme
VDNVTIRDFEDRDRAAVAALWHSCGLIRSWNDPRADIDRKLARADGGFFVAARDGEVVATVMAGYDGHRGWINYLAVDPSCQGDGVGRRIMERAEEHLVAAGCPKINLQIRAENSAAIQFYERLGFSVDDVVSMGKRLVHDESTPEQ